MTKLDLKTIQKLQLDMLIIFDKFCRENNLRYSLIGGTLLGAVRHKGFIPWDDDIDVAMPLPDYKKLIELWDNTKSERFKLASNYTGTFSLAFSCINDTTTVLKNFHTIKPTTSAFFKGVDEHIRIDIFCFSGLPSNIKQKVNFCKKAQNICICTGATNAHLHNIFLAILLFPYYLVWRVIGHKHFLKKYEKHIAQIDYDKAEFIGRPGEGSQKCVMIPKTDFDNLIELEFEGKRFYSFPSYEYYLTEFYGNYMQLPPPSKRISHHFFNAFSLLF